VIFYIDIDAAKSDFVSLLMPSFNALRIYSATSCALDILSVIFSFSIRFTPDPFCRLLSLRAFYFLHFSSSEMVWLPIECPHSHSITVLGGAHFVLITLFSLKFTLNLISTLSVD